MFAQHNTMTKPKTPMAAFSFGDISFVFKFLGHMARTSGPDISFANIKRFLTAKEGNKQRFSGLTNAIAVDPYVLQYIVHSTEGDYAQLGDSNYIPRDFDLFMRCSLELGHRGDFIPTLFNELAPGSAFNSTPEKYGGCPFGNWDEYKDQEPHVMSTERYPEQLESMEKFIDEHMSKFIGKTEEIGKILRLLVWNLYTYSSYGVEPSDTTAHMMKVFDDYSPEFDYAFRMTMSNVPYDWSDALEAKTKELNDWLTSVIKERKDNIEDCKYMKDVWTDTIINHSDIDLSKSDGAVRAVYLAGMNNLHGAICGTIINDMKNDEKVTKYFAADPERNIEFIYREALRLYTSIPIARNVREEDNFVLDGKKLEAGTSVILPTYGINTDPRSWEEPMEFNPARFENTKEIAFLCQKGFAPFGVAASLGGRQCGGRHVAVHVLKVLLAKLLRDYKFTGSGGGYFDFKHNSGASLYAGKCYVKVEKR